MAVARYTLIELSRRRILLVFLVVGVAGILILGGGLRLIYQYQSANPGSLGRNSPATPAELNQFLELLFVSYVFGALGIFAEVIAFAIGMTAIYHDLDSGAAISIFSKPVTRAAFAVGKIVAALIALVVIVGVLAVEARVVMALFGGGLEDALTGQVLAVVANTVVVMLIVLALTTWMNNIVAAVAAFIYYNVVTAVIAALHTFTEQGVINNDALKFVFGVAYWIIPHELTSSAVGDLVRASARITPSSSSAQALNSIPPASGPGDVAWWAFVVVVFAGVVYYSVRRRQV